MFRISIKHALMLAIAGLVVLTTAVTQFSTHVATERALVDQMREIVARDTLQAARQTRQFLDAADASSHLTAALLESGALSITRTQDLEDHLLETLAELPQVAGAFVASPEGDFVFVSRDTSVPGAATRTKVINVEDDRRTTQLTWRTEEGWILTTTLDPEDDFDPTLRPWYAQAVGDGGGWSEPYVFFTARAPGVTVSQPVVINGDIKAVVGLDVELDGVSTFLANLKTSENSSAMILNEDLTVVAHPTLDVVVTDGEDLRYRNLDEIEDAGSSAAHDALVASGFPVSGGLATPVSFDLGSGRHHAAFTELETEGLDWLITVEAPEADYLGVVVASRRQGLVWAGILALLAVAAAYWVARSLSRPILELADEATEVADGRLEDRQVHSRYVEIEETATALHRAYEQLDRRVMERTIALADEARERKQAEERALAASQAKSDYLASVSHELRTPLTSVVGFAELLDESDHHLTDQERSDYLGLIRNSGEHVLSLIDELLDLARIEAGEASLDETDVAVCELVADVSRLFIPQARERGVDLATVGSPTLVLADERRLRQVALNLIANALKYTPTGGEVVVDVGTSGGRIVLEVSDNGVGMTEEEIVVARHRFGRVADNADLAKGTGLGLALTQQIMTAHGGGVDISSVKGEGTTVTAWLPEERLLTFA